MKPTVADSRTPNLLILRGPTGDLPAVTAEVAGSSPVVPAIHSKRVERIPLKPSRRARFRALICVPFRLGRFALTLQRHLIPTAVTFHSLRPKTPARRSLPELHGWLARMP